jgi:hypothetical protein
MTELYLTEKQTEFYPRENRPCKRYNPGKDRLSIKKDSLDSIKCRRSILWEHLKEKINCSIVGIEEFFDHPNEMSLCQSIDEAESTFSIIAMLFSQANRTMWDDVCPLPCIQVVSF